MLTAVRFLAVMTGAVLLVGCSQAGGPSAEGTAPAPAHVRGVLIGQVVTHDTKVSIVGGGGDLRVVVRKTDGTMIADGITLAELRTRDAELYEVVTSARASAEQGTGGHGQSNYVDATLDLGHIN